MKILHLVLFSREEIYNEMYKITSDFYKFFVDVKTIYYTYSNLLNNDYEMIDDILLIKGEESCVPGILDKTIKSFLYFKDEINNYDLIVRSNISTIVDFNMFKNELEHINIDYGGGNLMTLWWLDVVFGIIDNKWFGTKFAQGTCVIFSRSTMNFLLENIDKIDFKIIDDVSLGIFIKTQMPSIQPFGLNPYFVHCKEYNDIQPLIEIVNSSKYIFYRNSNPNRKIDIEQIRCLTKLLNEKYL